MQELTQVITNNIGSVVTAGAFIWYLSQKAKIDQARDEGFNKIISNHLDHATAAQNTMSESNRQLATELERLSGLINAWSKKNK